jgi:hypothetical protein
MGRVLIFDGTGAAALSSRLQKLGLDPIQVVSFDEALCACEHPQSPVDVVLIPSSLAEEGSLKSELRRLHKAGTGPHLGLLVFGPPAERSLRKKLRATGVKLALWEPFDNATLRFQLNRALAGEGDESGRRRPRVPTYLLSRVSIGGRDRDAVVYSLSESGAFLETPRARMEGARAELEIRLPGEPLHLRGLVIYANVPGNLQRPNLPLGMGVRFEGLSTEHAKRLKDYVERRVAELEV